MIAIIKYNAGNTASVSNAIRKLGYDCIVTDDRSQLVAANKVIFPGVGQAASAMEYLISHQLDDLIVSLKQPVLGICLGLQLLCTESEEGMTKGLGIFNTRVKQFPASQKVPHMGWNNFTSLNSPLFKKVKLLDDAYFVHSYYAETCADTTATCDYILPFSAALQKDNFYAVQFHPEKSAAVGEQILKNFLEL